MHSKTFNTAGPCDPEWHYMLPPEARLEEAGLLIEQARYFVVHAPRQAGKTTAVRSFAERLTREGRYTALWVSCEGAQAAGEDVRSAIGAVLDDIDERARALPPELQPPKLSEVGRVGALTRLYVYLHRWSQRSPRPVVLFFDEIDALLGRSLISVLRQLRSGFPERPKGFPQSIALIGLRDVREGTTSPFISKVDSLNLRDFTAAEVASLCRQHQHATGQELTSAALQKIYQLTHGQPWLVNALASQLVEIEVSERCQPITEADVEKASEKLILRRDTHFDSLAARLHEKPVQRVLLPLIAGSRFGQEVDLNDLDLVLNHGLMRFEDGNLVIANPIYGAIIHRTYSELA